MSVRSVIKMREQMVKDIKEGKRTRRGLEGEEAKFHPTDCMQEILDTVRRIEKILRSKKRPEKEDCLNRP